MALSKTVALERVRKKLEQRTNQHGYIDESDCRDVLLDLVDELEQEAIAAAAAAAGETPPQP